jgi:hypothetical protein
MKAATAARGRSKQPLHVELAAIRVSDTTTQARESIDQELVETYAEQMRAGDVFPAIELFEESGAYYIGDGWHRFLAAQKNGDVATRANVSTGGRIEAIKHALGANARHGMPRTNADKRKAVVVALREFGNLSNVKIARICAVSDKTVAAARTANLGNSEVATRTGADGKQHPSTAKRARPAEDSAALAVLVAVIDAGLPAINELSEALIEVRDGKLFRGTHRTFEDYCRETWGITDPKIFIMEGDK